MSIYYTYLTIPKKVNPSYSTFKTKHLPFPWDRNNTNEEEEFDTMSSEKEQPLSPNEWADRIKNLKKDKQLNTSQVNSI